MDVFVIYYMQDIEPICFIFFLFKKIYFFPYKNHFFIFKCLFRILRKIFFDPKMKRY